jgi:hypothetical protein
MQTNSSDFTWVCPICYDTDPVQNSLICNEKLKEYDCEDFYCNMDSSNVQYYFLSFNYSEYQQYLMYGEDLGCYLSSC